jgi:hypothetical protein
MNRQVPALGDRARRDLEGVRRGQPLAGLGRPAFEGEVIGRDMLMRLSHSQQSVDQRAAGELPGPGVGTAAADASRRPGAASKRAEAAQCRLATPVPGPVSGWAPRLNFRGPGGVPHKHVQTGCGARPRSSAVQCSRWGTLRDRTSRIPLTTNSNAVAQRPHVLPTPAAAAPDRVSAAGPGRSAVLAVP